MSGPSEKRNACRSRSCWKTSISKAQGFFLRCSDSLASLCVDLSVLRPADRMLSRCNRKCKGATAWRSCPPECDAHRYRGRACAQKHVHGHPGRPHRAHRKVGTAPIAAGLAASFILSSFTTPPWEEGISVEALSLSTVIRLWSGLTVSPTLNRRPAPWPALHRRGRCAGTSSARRTHKASPPGRPRPGPA